MSWLYNDINWLYDLSYEELIDYIVDLQARIDYLVYELDREKKKSYNKANKEFEENKAFISQLIESVVKKI